VSINDRLKANRERYGRKLEQVRAYLDSDEDANRKGAAWAEAYAEVERVERLGESLGFGDAPIQEPPELRGYVQEASQA
jgi:hypothetical protein